MRWVRRRSVVREQRLRVGFAVRRDWPDGAHDFVLLRASRAGAGLEAMGERRYWMRSHFRPRLSIVEISGHEFALHVGRSPCRAPDCATQAEAAVGVAQAGVWS